MVKFFSSFTAVFFPWLTFFLRDMPLQGIVAMALQATLIGWIPASIWAWKTIHSTPVVEPPPQEPKQETPQAQSPNTSTPPKKSQ